MKKYITIAISIIFGANMALATPPISSPRGAVAKAPTQPNRVDAPAQPFADDSWKTLGNGKFCDPVMVNLFDGFTTEEIEVEVEESEQHPEVYRIVTPWPTAPSHPEANYMIVDARDPEFVQIPAQITPVYDAADGVTWICSMSFYEMEYADGSKDDFMTYFSKYNISREGDAIKFPAGCAMYMWPNATSPYALPGEWTAAYFAKNAGYLILPGKEAETEQWVELGKGELFDGFFYSFINPAVEAITLEVTIMENSRKPGQYKVVNPFRFVSAESNDMMIDATDPDFVRIFEQSSGISAKSQGEDVGEIWYYSFSSLANFPTRDALVASGYGHLNITLADGIIDIPAQSIVYFLPEINKLEYYNNDYAVPSYIKLPKAASSAPILESGNADAEYFNLQGIRVPQPQKGQLLIERRGSKCRKIIF